MVPCKEYENALVTLLEGGEDAETRAHLQSCAACRAALDSLQAMDARLTTLAALYAQNAPEVDLVDTVMNQLGQLKAREQSAEAPEAFEDADIMAFIEDELEVPVRRRMERAAETDPALQQEIEALSSLHGELLRIGEAAVRLAPQVDLVDNVMQAVNLAKAPQAKVVPFKARPRQAARRPESSVRIWQWAAFAAAACLVTGLWFAAESLLPGGKTPATAPAVSTVAKNTGLPKPAPVEKTFQEGEYPPPAPEEGEVNQGEVTPGSDAAKKQISLQDAINARRKAALGQVDFEKWASLTPDEARELLKKGGLKPGVIAALTQSLPPEEAAAYLREAVKQNPNDPYLRYMLAKSLADNPNAGSDALNQLAEWSQRDPQNSMHQFMEARVRFEQGDSEGALNALTRASALKQSSAYSRQTAQSQEEALALSGMSSDAAAYVAAANMGSSESSAISSLGTSLLQQGNYYQSIGDTDSAQQVYSAVVQLGAQLAESASVTSEQAAGYDVELQALEALRQLYELLADPTNLQTIESLYNSVRDGLAQLLSIIDQLDSALLSSSSQSALDQANQLVNGNSTLGQ